jgi:hypothetical protein
MMLAVAVVAFVVGFFVSCLRWLQYPHINVTIFNETSAPICDLHLSFFCGNRTADQLRPGGVAVAEIQSNPEAGIFLSYLDLWGDFRKAVPLLYGNAGDRGYLEVHVTNQGLQVVNGIYCSGGETPVLGICRVRPTGKMRVE